MVISTSAVADLDAMNVELHKMNLLPVYAKFTTTGATCVVAMPNNFRSFRVVGTCWAAASASDEILSVDDSAHTIGTDGVHLGVAIATGGYSVQFIRTGASKTSGLGFFALII